VRPDVHRAFLAALVLAGSACTLVEREPELRLVLVSPAYGSASHAIVRVETEDAARAHVVVNGRETGTVAVNEEVIVHLGRERMEVPEGRYEIGARVYRGGSVQDSAIATVAVDRSAPRFRVAPPFGEVVDPNPFRVVLTFDEPLDPASVGASTVRLVDATNGSRIPANVSLSADAREIVVQADRPLPEYGAIGLELEVRDRAGLAGVIAVPPWEPHHWSAPQRFGILFATPDGPYVGGIVTIHVLAFSSEQVIVTVDGVRLGAVTGEGSLAWDTRLWPDGPVTVRAEWPGRISRVSPLPLHVVNGAPGLVACSVDAEAPWAGFIEAEFDRPLGEFGSASGYRCIARTTTQLVCWLVAPFLPVDVSTTIQFGGAVRSATGVAAEGAASCSAVLPAWRAPFGEGALTDRGAPLRGIAVAVGSLRPGPPDTDRVTAFRIRLDGTLEELTAVAPAAPATGRTIAASATQLTVVRGDPLWVESSGGELRIRGANPQEVIIARPADADVRLVDCTWAPAWTERSSDGRRVLLLASADGSTTTAANVDPAASIGDAAASGYRVAFVETGADGIGRLYVRDSPDGIWDAPQGPLNAVATAAASEPAILGGVLAWVEDGAVLARVAEPGSAWMEPEVLASGGSAHSPKVIAPNDGIGWTTVVFVERGVDEDRFEVRRFDPFLRQWSSYPPLRTGGRVASYSLSGDAWSSAFAILWGDETGDVRLRIPTAWR
jgi:hypothetical protein